MSNKELLERWIELNGDYCTLKLNKEAWEELRALLRRDWSVRVLDAQAKRLESKPVAPSYVGVTSRVDGSRLGYWRISVDGIRALQGDCQGMFPSEDAARHAAALAVFPTLDRNAPNWPGERP